MTTDAKVGLLLGLVFIVVIAFLINGLPHFLRGNDTDELSVSTNTLTDRSLVIGDQAVPATGADAALPEPRTVDAPQGERVVQTFSGDQTSQIVQDIAQKPLENTPVSEGIKTPEQNTRTYIVESGDSLDAIVSRVYGPKVSNRDAAIDKIASANKLASKHKISIGQKLIIPQLEGAASADDASRLANENPDMFVKVDGVSKPQPSKPVSDKPAVSKGKQREYVVQKDDSLWKIASKMLGDGSRYKEIKEFNKQQLRGSDELQPGMRLILPAR